jgi:hypothetical protein
VAIIHGDFALAAQSNVSVFALVIAALAQGVALTAARFGGISTHSRLRITLGSCRVLSTALLSVWLLRLGGLLPLSP